MFQTTNLPLTVTKLTVDVRDANDEHTHVLTVAFRTPFSHELAQELSATVARDLFARVTMNGQSSMVPKPELNAVRLTLLTRVYGLELRAHPDLAPTKKDIIPHVKIKSIVAVKEETGAGMMQWVLSFKITFDLEDFDHLVRLARSLKMGVFATFVDEEPGLFAAADAPEPPGTGMVYTGPGWTDPPSDDVMGAKADHDIVEGHLLTDGATVPDFDPKTDNAPGL